ncbi:MAG: HAD-IA family hydrolase [Bacteroidales bacterium]|nr:HAD-IA family hydrolase [Bacteroidales bacterium]
MYQEAILSYLSKNNIKKIDLKAVLFDMDGVLFDSMPIHAVAWTQTLREEGLTFTEEESYLHEGRTGSGTIDIVFNREFGRNATPEEIDRIYQKKSDLFDHSPEAPVMPGALELLEEIRENGLNRILVTGSGQQALLSKLNQFFPDQFTESRMVTAYDVVKGKPDPEPYLQGLCKAGVKAGQAIVVENAPLGVEAAKAAGIFTIAVNTGKLKDHYLLDAGADLLFHGMPALEKAWPEVYRAFQMTEK